MSPHTSTPGEDAPDSPSRSLAGIDRRGFITAATVVGFGLPIVSAPAAWALASSPSPKLPGEARRQEGLTTALGKQKYDAILVKINGDAARLFVPQTIKPGSPTHVVWFYHAAESDQEAIMGGYRAAAERVVDEGAIGICQNAGGTLYSNPIARQHQVSGYAYLSGIYDIVANYLRATSAGGALAVEAYGAPLMPDVHGLYLVNAVYDTRSLYNMGGRQTLSVGMAFNYNTAQIDAYNPARFAQSAWTDSSMRVVVSSPSSSDTSVPPDKHGLALIAKAKPVALEASVRTHSQGHTTPGFADVDFTQSLERWIAIVEAGTPPDEPDLPTPVARWNFTEAAAPFISASGGLALANAGARPALKIASPWGSGIRLDGGAWLRLGLSSAAALNLGARTGRMTIAAWVRRSDTDSGFVAGMWHDKPDAPARCYGLFYDLATYGGDDRVCVHVSRTGLPTPGYPSAREYAATSEKITAGQWQLYVGTYDGAVITGYLDGVASAYPDFTDNRGKTYSKNPYSFTAGINPIGADFTVGASLSGTTAGNFAIADVAGLRGVGRGPDGHAGFRPLYRRVRLPLIVDSNEVRYDCGRLHRARQRLASMPIQRVDVEDWSIRRQSCCGLPVALSGTDSAA